MLLLMLYLPFIVVVFCLMKHDCEKQKTQQTHEHILSQQKMVHQHIITMDITLKVCLVGIMNIFAAMVKPLTPIDAIIVVI